MKKNKRKKKGYYFEFGANYIVTDNQGYDYLVDWEKATEIREKFDKNLPKFVNVHDKFGNAVILNTWFITKMQIIPFGGDEYFFRNNANPRF